MAKHKEQNYMYGAAILTAGVIIMKVLGAFYKIPIANIIGDDGYSMFLAAYNVYYVFFILATAGLPIALSRLISEAKAEKRPMQARRTFNVALGTFFAIGLFCTALMFFGAEFLATDILHNPEAAPSIRAMAPALLLVCLMSAYRGYCQGYGNMIPTTVGQVLEVLFKVIAGLALALVVVGRGMDKPYASAAAISGVTVGSLIALVYMVSYKARNYKDRPEGTPDKPDSRAKIFRYFMRIGVPIALGSCVMSILNLLDSSLCMGRLQSAAGFSLDEAQVLYGVYGKAQNLFNLPAAFITPLTISVVPAIAAAIVRGEDDNATMISEDSMRISAALSMPMGVGLAVLCDPIMKIMYPSSHEAGPVLLCIMGLASIFVCLLLMENAVLQASGKEKYTMYTMIVGGAVKVIINWFLVADPKINIYGAPIGTLASYFVMCAMNYVFMCVTLDKNPRLWKIVSGPLASSLIMGAGAWAVYGLAARFIGVGSWLHMAVCMMAAVAVAVLLYLVCVVCLRVITKEDLNLIPGGAKIARLLHMK